ncbi:MAG: cbb3-type cytochrome c oxidase subunit I [Pseudomonadota bacterium]
MMPPLISVILLQKKQKLAKAWLFLGIFSLFASGVFSILLVLSRTPFIQKHLPFADFFHTAIVVHVDLSVLIWFTCFASVLWTITCKHENWLDWLALKLAILGTIIIIISPFIMDGHPLMNNYIPILQTPLFYAGLAFYSLGLLLRIIRSLIFPLQNPFIVLKAEQSFSIHPSIMLGIYCAALTAFIAFMVFIFSLINLPDTLQPEAYFEVLFWGSGHILQFTHLLLVCVVWLLLLQTSAAKSVTKSVTTINYSVKYLSPLFIISFLPVLFAPFLYLYYDLLSTQLQLQFTNLMKFGSLTALPLGVVIFYFMLASIFQKNKQSALIYSLWCSFFLFAFGGFLGFMIEGANVIIPAHYHGSIVAITIAFMGLSYYLLEQFNYPLTPLTAKLAKIQPVIYTIGQFMHISGLAWSGGYGVKRKTLASAQGWQHFGEIAGMLFMGLGGLIAIIGGFLFIVIAFLAIKQARAIKNH